MKYGVISLLVGAFFFLHGGELALISSDEVKDLISDNSVDHDYILIDVRNDNEVADGIIASEFCRPYHMSWSYGVLEEHYEKLPKDMAIIVYCRSGNRSGSAGNFLIEKGFTNVASMTGGINGYPGELSDDSLIKPMSLLPEPSYKFISTKTVFSRGIHPVSTVSSRHTRDFRVTLNGKSDRRLSSGATAANQLHIHFTERNGARILWKRSDRKR